MSFLPIQIVRSLRLATRKLKSSLFCSLPQQTCRDTTSPSSSRRRACLRRGHLPPFHLRPNQRKNRTAVSPYDLPKSLSWPIVACSDLRRRAPNGHAAMAAAVSTLDAICFHPVPHRVRLDERSPAVLLLPPETPPSASSPASASVTPSVKPGREEMS